MPPGLLQQATSLFRGLLLREWAKRPLEDPHDDAALPIVPGAALPFPSSCSSSALMQRYQQGPPAAGGGVGGGGGAWPSSRRQAPAPAPSGLPAWLTHARQLHELHPCFLLALHCPPAHVQLDGEVDKSAVTLAHEVRWIAWSARRVGTSPGLEAGWPLGATRAPSSTGGRAIVRSSAWGLRGIATQTP